MRTDFQVIDLKPGDPVTVTTLHRRGRVLEIDHAMNVARIALWDGVELWALLDDLMPVIPWAGQRTGSAQ